MGLIASLLFLTSCAQDPIGKKTAKDTTQSGVTDPVKPEKEPMPGPAPLGDDPSDDVKQTLQVARDFLGYHYWWGGARLVKGDPNKGWCQGGCPNCTRGGTSGADCSGLVAKAWRLPPAMPLDKQAHPYSTAVFVQKDHTYWKSVSMTEMKAGDAPAYNANGRGHIVVVSEANSTNWGQPKVIEAKGCSWGIIENVKKLTENYQNRRKK